MRGDDIADALGASIRSRINDSAGVKRPILEYTMKERNIERGENRMVIDNACVLLSSPAKDCAMSGSGRAKAFCVRANRPEKLLLRRYAQPLVNASGNAP